MAGSVAADTPKAMRKGRRPVAPAVRSARLRPMTESDAGDPTTYADLVDAIVDEATSSGSRLTGGRGKAMVKALGTACAILTGYTLTEAKAKGRDPLENLRDVMARGAALANRIAELYVRIDRLRPIAAQKADYELPIYPAVGEILPVAEAPEATARHEDAQRQFRRVLTVINNMLSGEATGLNTRQLLDMIDEACQATVGESLATVAREGTDPARRVTDILTLPEGEIRELAAAYRRMNGPTPSELARWDGLCEKVILLQAEARRDPARFAVYVGRVGDALHAGELLDMQWFHVALQDIWALPKATRTATCQPNGMGKSTQFRLRRCWRIGNRPEVRRLVILSDQDKAEMEVGATLRLMTDPAGYYRAVFPHIRVLGRTEGAKKTAKTFSVARKNQAYARDATVTAAGSTCNIEGEGFDEIDLDDPQDITARHYAHVRDEVAWRIEGPIPSRLRVAADQRMDAVCTPIHPDDWLGRLRRAHAAGERPSWKITIGCFAHRFDPASGRYTSLWDKVITADQLREMSRGAFFKCTHLLEDTLDDRRVVSGVRYYPADPDDALWARTNEAYRKRCLDRLRLIRGGEQWISIDPSGTRGKRSSLTAVGRFSLVPGEKPGSVLLYLIRVDLRPGDSSALREWIIEQVVGPELFKQRYIHPDDSDEVKKAKRDLWGQKTAARGNIKGVLIEGTGGQASGTNLIRDDVPLMVREMGIDWSGTVQNARATAPGGKTNIGKRVRLTECAHLLTGGYVKFPGSWMVQDGDASKIRLTAMDDGPQAGAVKTLVDQIVHFEDNRSNDGVDMVTMILLNFHAQLTRELPASGSPNTAAPEGAESPFREAMRKQLRDIFEAPSADDPEDRAEQRFRETLSQCA